MTFGRPKNYKIPGRQWARAQVCLQRERWGFEALVKRKHTAEKSRAWGDMSSGRQG